MGTAANLDIGPCSVKFGTSGSEVDLGYTIGGVKVAVETEIQEIEVDQETDAVDALIRKRTVRVEAPLAEYTIENLLIALPGAQLVTDATTPTKKKLLIKSAAGSSLLTLAKSLVLHPTDNLASDVSEDWTFTKAVSVGNVETVYDKENPKVLTLTFRCFPDNGVTGIFGDTSATAAS